MPKKPPSKKPAKKTSKKAQGLTVVPEVSKIEDAREKKASKKKPKSDMVVELENAMTAMADSIKESMGAWKPVSGTIAFGRQFWSEANDAGESVPDDGILRAEAVPPEGSLNVIGLSAICEPHNYLVTISVLDKTFASNVDAATFRTHRHVGELYPMDLGLVNEKRPIVLKIRWIGEEPPPGLGCLDITFYGRPVEAETE